LLVRLDPITLIRPKGHEYTIKVLCQVDAFKTIRHKLIPNSMNSSA